MLPTGTKQPGTTHIKPSLRRTLRAKDYFTLAFGSMVGVGWMLVIDDWLGRGGSAGAMVGFLIGGLILFPVGYVYGRMTERMPDAGSEVAYTGAVFSRGISFATGWMMSLAYLIVCPYEAVAIGRIGSYVFPQLNVLKLYVVGGYTVYLPHVVLGLLLTLVIVTLNYTGVRLSASFQNAATFGLLAIFAIFGVVGVIGGNPANLRPLFAHDLGLRGGLLSTVLVLQIVPYFMTGFEAAPKCSEEAAADFDPRYYKRMIYLALGAGTFFYVAVIGVVSLIQPWQTLTTVNFATAVAFERAFRSKLLV
ncbi:MAG TPA: APC family permease, partial [Blastocatellia bacterium]|nr:APC family permease [Blastocatellia bacterium]